MIEARGKDSSCVSITIRTDKVKQPILVEDIYFSIGREVEILQEGSVPGGRVIYQIGERKMFESYFSMKLRLNDWLQIRSTHSGKLEIIHSLEAIELYVTYSKGGSYPMAEHILHVYITSYEISDMEYIVVKGKLEREPQLSYLEKEPI